MPTKSRYGRGRQQRAGVKARPATGASDIKTPVGAKPPPPTTLPSSAKPAVKAKAPQSPEAISYPYIGRELKFIGILSAAIMVILIILALVLR